MIEIRKSNEFDRWLKGLKDDRAVARIAARITRLSLGNPGDVKPVGGGVSEMRIDYGSGYRVYYIRRGHTPIVLLGGGTKRTQQRDIEAAKMLAEALKE